MKVYRGMVIFCLAFVASLAVVVSCGDNSSGTGDGPVGLYNDSPSYVINMPDGFANIAMQCVAGTGIYDTTREAPPTVVPNDPLCKEGGFFDHLNLTHNRDIPIHPTGGDK